MAKETKAAEPKAGVAKGEFDPVRGVPPGDSSDTPGRVPPNTDQLGCGAGLTVSDHEQSMIQRLAELRTTPHGNSPGLFVNHGLMLACRDACLRAQGGGGLDVNQAEYFARFGWRGEHLDMIRLASVNGRPDNPPDAGDLIHVVARQNPDLMAILTSPDVNCVGLSVDGSCYALRGWVAVGWTQNPAP